MDAKARKEYSILHDGDWKMLGYDENPLLRQNEPRLEGDIHPLFQYKIPGRPDSDPIWPLYTPEQYENHLVDLNPVFQLATRILQSPASLDYFYWLIYSPRTDAEPPVWNLGERVSEYRRDDKSEDDRRKMSREALDRLALTHWITIEKSEEVKHAAGLTKARSIGINIKDDTSAPSGVNSQIIINQEYLDKLAKLRAGGSINHLRTLNLRFKMAITLLHELAVSTSNPIELNPEAVMRCDPSYFSITLFDSRFAVWTDADLEALQHTVSNARNQEYLANIEKEEALQKLAESARDLWEPQVAVSNEDLFEDENSAEAGYSWEAFVFGGRVELDFMDASRPLLFSKWPSFLIGGPEYLRRGGWKSSVTRYLVSMHYVLNINRQGFWDSTDAREIGDLRADISALYIKKVIGIRIPCQYQPDIDPNWDASDSSEGVWHTDSQISSGPGPSARVSRIRPGRTIVDPSASRANESGEDRLERDIYDYLQGLSLR